MIHESQNKRVYGSASGLIALGFEKENNNN